MQKARLDDWYVAIPEGYDDFTAPEMIKPRLFGIVSGHPLHKDGTEVCVGYVVSVDKQAGTVSTARTVYTIGQPKADYLAMFPDALARLFAIA